MAKIILIDPYGWQGAVCGNVAYPNVGLAYLIPQLRKAGHEVLVIDLNNGVLPEAQIISTIEQYHPDMIGFSVKTATIRNARSLSQRIKSCFPSLAIILGGPHTTIAWSELAKEPWFDIVFVGEAEEQLPVICANLLNNNLLSGLPGVVSKNNFKPDLISQPPRISNLDILPFPEYHLFPKNVREFIQTNYPLVTSRGCVYKCVYCSVPKISGQGFRSRSAQNIIEELIWAAKTYEVRGFEIIDDVFNLNIKRCKEICRALIEADLRMTWACPNGLRADRVDEELAELMFKSGCHTVMVGIESASPEVFATVNKGETIEDIQRGIRTFKKAGIKVGGYFIVGLPGDSFKSQEKSVAFAKRMGIDAHFSILIPYPGTELWGWAQKNARFIHSVEDGLYFADSFKEVEPVIETDSFPASEYQRAYEMANTRFGKFERIIPKDISKQEYYFKIFKLLWYYNKIQLPLFIAKMIFGKLRRIFRDCFRFLTVMSRNKS